MKVLLESEVANKLEVETGMAGDDFVGEMTHGKTKNDKYCVGACDDGYNYDDFFWREKPEIKKFADRLNGKGQNDDTTNED